MRYKKGSKVEVLSKDEVPSGSWQCAEIICGNGHNYTVRYTDDTIVERVSRRSIRPIPPLVHLGEGLIPGDVLEVFHNHCWKMATVSKASDSTNIVVRLVGFPVEFKVRKCDLRVRQCWQDDKWTVIGKGTANYEYGKQNQMSNLRYIHKIGRQVKKTSAKLNLHVKDHCFDARDKVYFQESRDVSSRSLKRSSPCCYSQVEAYEGSALKFRVAKKDGIIHRFSAIPSLLPEKVEAVASTREMLGDKHVHASSNKRASCFNLDSNTETFGCSRVVSLEPNGADSITCSVGSCSINRHPYEFPYHLSRFEDNEGICSDAESFCQLGCEKEHCLLPSKEELVAEIHRLELHAYRCTIEVLHASGPLSWEQESLVTDLRMSLHISNDEHLMEGQSKMLVRLVSEP